MGYAKKIDCFVAPLPRNDGRRHTSLRAKRGSLVTSLRTNVKQSKKKIAYNYLILFFTLSTFNFALANSLRRGIIRASAILLLLAASVQLSTAQARDFAYSGFSGGMMVHTGYLWGGEITLNGGSGAFSRRLKGAPFGLGGVARVHLGKHLRVGGEGYVSTLNYGGPRNDSHARIGWGGILADCVWHVGRWSPYVGGTLGGGTMRNLTLENRTPLDNTTETGVSFRRYGFMVLVPFAGVEVAMTPKIRLNLKADWMINLTNRQRDFPTGPRLYLGISFYRARSSLITNR